jgi:hypothetical protein
MRRAAFARSAAASSLAAAVRTCSSCNLLPTWPNHWTVTAKCPKRPWIAPPSHS